MNTVGDLNLWALGYAEHTRAKEVRDELLRFENNYGLHVLDAVVVSRQPDGTFAVARDEPANASSSVVGFGVLGFLVGLVVLEPLAGAALGVTLGGLVGASAKKAGIDDAFVADVKALMTPGSSALFVLTTTDNPDAAAYDIRGLGGTVLKTNVNAELAERVQRELGTPRSTA